MKRKVTTLIIIILCFLAESSLFQFFSIGTITPNLLVIVVASFGFMRGRKEGMFVGFTCGIFVDLFWGSGLGLYMMFYSFTGFLNGSFKRLFYDDDLVLPIFLIGCSEFFYGVFTYICVYMLRGDFSFQTYLFKIILPELVYTVLVTLVLYQVILYINKKLETEEQRSASKFV